MQTLSVTEALKQGYTKYCFNSDGFQGLKDIDGEIDPSHFERDDIRIVNKEPYTLRGMCSKDIAELIAEHIECNHVDDSGDDTEQVYDAIKELDFTDAENKITEALSKLHYYRATDIRLVADTQGAV
jgi:hypothetical protein